jgi:hypothetical protein
MPRGPIQDTSARSRQLMSVPTVASSTVAGRTRKITTATRAMECQSRCSNTTGSRSAVSSTNTDDTITTLMYSLKRRSSVLLGSSALPRVMPMAVAASKPASLNTRLARP